MRAKSFGVGALTRAVGVICAVLIIATGVTFAALQSPQAVLANNSITSATADLRIGTSAASFAASRTGFDFKDLVPGGAAVPVDGNLFWLKNYGNANLKLHISIGSIPVNTNSVDLTKVSLVATRIDTNVSQTFTLQSLVDGYISGGTTLTDPLAGGAVAQYKLQAVMANDAFSGVSATVGDIDIVFTGTGIN
jgi:hypothetical protein